MAEFDGWVFVLLVKTTMCKQLLCYAECHTLKLTLPRSDKQLTLMAELQEEARRGKHTPFTMSLTSPSACR